jgi:O-antigen/teichoic acid export membrane protein
MPFVSGGILYPISVEYFKRPKETYSTFFTSANAIPLVSIVVLTALCFLFQGPLSNIIKVPAPWIWIMPITAWLIMINDTLLMLIRNRNNPVLFATLSIGKNVVEIGLTLLLVVGLHWTWQGRLASAALTPLLLGSIAIYFFFRWQLVAKKIDWNNTRRIFLLAFPFIFERLAVFVLGYSDRYFIDRFDPDKTREVGLYGLGSQLATVIYLVIVSLNSAYQPHLFKKLSEGFNGKIHKTTGWYIGACAVIAAGMFAAIPFIFRFFIGHNYQEAKPYAYILCSGYFMWGVYNSFQAYLIYLEKNRQILWISLFGMITSLVLNSVMVINYGAVGAAIASVATYSVMALACYLLVRKYFLFRKAEEKSAI